LIKPAAFQAGVPPQAEHLTPDTWNLKPAPIIPMKRMKWQLLTSNS